MKADDPSAAGPEPIQGMGWLKLATARDIGAIASLFLGLITLLGLVKLTHGTLIDAWIGLLRGALGWGASVAPAAVIVLSLLALRRKPEGSIGIGWGQLLMLELVYFSGLGLLAVMGGVELAEAEMGQAGGIVGWAIATLLGSAIGPFGRLLLLLTLFVACGYYGSAPLLARFAPGSVRLVGPAREGPGRPDAPPVEHATKLSAGEPGPRGEVLKQSPTPKAAQSARGRAARRREARLLGRRDGGASSRATAKRDPGLPSLEVFASGESSRVTENEILSTARLIEATLADFGLPVKVVDHRSGPAVTQYAVEPGYLEGVGLDGKIRRQKVRVGQISALANDLALSLSTPSLRIEAPVPGKAFVGIEVPNRHPATVRLRPILEAEPLDGERSRLGIALGRNVAGAPVVADLATMPHLLIAGTTGSGKSVCIAALTACLAVNHSPAELRLVMIDPKMVELLRFNGLPHLYGKVETELERISGVLRWGTQEMDRRFRLLEAVRARDIDAYNRKRGRGQAVERLSRIVIMIDELADLMMLAPDQTESSLVRLAQMARATGIHLVVATQRPSTDILTGLIKANFPSRIAFAVASATDSRVILDTQGAETLLGRGDMLYLPQEAAAPIRLQGVYVDDREIEALVRSWKAQGAAMSAEAPWEEFLHRQGSDQDQDGILDQAIELVTSTGRASASLLQRRLRIGYPRAARIMDELEELGVIGRPQGGGRTREVLAREDGEA